MEQGKAEEIAELKQRILRDVKILAMTYTWPESIPASFDGNDTSDSCSHAAFRCKLLAEISEGVDQLAVLPDGHYGDQKSKVKDNAPGSASHHNYSEISPPDTSKISTDSDDRDAQHAVGIDSTTFSFSDSPPLLTPASSQESAEPTVGTIFSDKKLTESIVTSHAFRDDYIIGRGSKIYVGPIHDVVNGKKKEGRSPGASERMLTRARIGQLTGRLSRMPQDQTPEAKSDVNTECVPKTPTEQNVTDHDASSTVSSEAYEGSEVSQSGPVGGTDMDEDSTNPPAKEFLDSCSIDIAKVASDRISREIGCVLTTMTMLLPAVCILGDIIVRSFAGTPFIHVLAPISVFARVPIIHWKLKQAETDDQRFVLQAVQKTLGSLVLTLAWCAIISFSLG